MYWLLVTPVTRAELAGEEAEISILESELVKSVR